TTAREAANARWFRRRYVAPVLLAAGIAGVLVVRAFDRYSAGGQNSIQLVQATSLTRERGSGRMTRTLGGGWDQPPWSATRGTEASLGPNPFAFRAGARYAEFELA